MAIMKVGAGLEQTAAITGNTPNMHSRKLTTSCNSSSEIECPLLTSVGTCTPRAHTHTHMNRNNILELE